MRPVPPAHRKDPEVLRSGADHLPPLRRPPRAHPDRARRSVQRLRVVQGPVLLGQTRRLRLDRKRARRLGQRLGFLNARKIREFLNRTRDQLCARCPGPIHHLDNMTHGMTQRDTLSGSQVRVSVTTESFSPIMCAL